MLVAVAAILPLAYRSERDRAERRTRASAAAIVLLPSLATLVLWFIAAPDVRFAFGSIWLVSIGLVAWLTPSRAGRRVILYATLVTAIVLGVGVGRAFMVRGADLWVAATGDDPFGSVAPDTVGTRPFTTASGLNLLVPVRGDQCWRIMWCTPYPNPRLALRGRLLWNGFSVSRR
jgi:hypothetical protein